MKSIKVLVLTFFLAVTAYGYVAQSAQSSPNKESAAASKDQGCCTTAKADCCKPDAECCKPDAQCCAAQMSCSDKNKQCCAGGGSATKDASKGVECCTMCDACSSESLKVAEAPAKTTAKNCCGSSCAVHASPKK
jgi:hypothetical protein